MATPELLQIAKTTQAEAVVEWIEREFQAPVVRLERLPRWRFGWFADVELADRMLPLYVRGARGPDFPSPFDLSHEVRVHDMLEAHGFPVPHVFGRTDVGFTEVLIMDRVPGNQGLMHEPDEKVRRRLMLDCIEHMAAMHKLTPQELARRGFDVPSTPRDIVWSGAIARLEQHYLTCGLPADPVIEFLRLWLRRNMPAGRVRPAFVTWDAAQFLHHEGHLTALIDFELAHVGDPYMDLSPLRSRDTMEPFGDLRGAFHRYGELMGEPVDMAVVRYYEIAQLTATLMLQRPVLLRPDKNSDLVTHIVWYVESGRYALDVLAEVLHAERDILSPIDAGGSAHAASHRHLVASLHRAARDPQGADDPLAEFRRWRSRCDYRLARHLQRVDEVGHAVAAAELADSCDVLARRCDDQAQADEAMLARIRLEDPDDDVMFLRYLDRRIQRHSMLLGPPTALLTQHVPLQPLPG